MKLVKLLARPAIFFLLFSVIVGLFPSYSNANFLPASSLSEHSDNAEIVPGQVIVKYKNPPKAKNSVGLKAISAQTFTLQFSAEINTDAKIAELEKDPNVEYAEPVYKVHYSVITQPDGSITSNVYYDPSQPSYMQNWGKTVFDLTYAKDLTIPAARTNQVIVAVVDTGVYMDHPELGSSRILNKPGYDFINNDTDPQDDNGHGTNVAGIIAAKAVDANGFSGVAPGTMILPVKVLNNKGEGTTSTVISGIDYAVAQGANIINLSLGTSEDSLALHESIQRAVQAGVLVVAAAGNEGNNLYGSDPGNLWDVKQDGTTPFTGKTAAITGYPAFYDEVISVGAMEQVAQNNYTIADFSNIGKIDVVAAGVNIYSTYRNPNSTRTHAYMSGTSQATPFVVGLGALLKANDSSLDAERLTAIIKNTALSVNSPKIQYVNGSFDSFDMYGYGVISGKFAVQRSKLAIQTAAAKFDSQNTAVVNVSIRNYQGAVSNEAAEVYGQIYQVSEDAATEADIYKYKSSSTINLLNGLAAVSLHNPEPNASFYHYSIFVNDGVRNSKDYIYSKEIELVNRPSIPVPSLVSGTYSGAQQISLSSTANDSIYYKLNNGAVVHYSGPITINQNSTLVTYALNNHVYSDDAGVYSYVINQATSQATPSSNNNNSVPPPPVYIPFFPPGVEGSPTATPSPTPTPTPKPADKVVIKGEDGKNSLEVKPDKDELLAQINTNSTEISVNAKSSQTTDSISVELDGEVMRKAKEKGKAVVIQSNDLQIHFAPDTLNLGASTSNVKFNAAVDNQDLPANIQSLSTIYDFNLTVDNVNTHTFNKPIEVHFSMDSAKVRNLNHVGVFYFNDSSQKWEYVGGTVNPDNTVTALLPHFSKYAVLENARTFNDIQPHWAKNEIEEMAAKQIINGMTETSFSPESTITRAQFVSLLARSLKLENSASSELFSDIPDNAWYKDEVYSAFNSHIVKGITERSFAPQDRITREQLATLLVTAYLQKTGKQLSDMATAQEVKYMDESSISSWAKSNVQIATTLGLMSGVGNGRFNPSGFATRAEAAVVLERFLKKVN